MSKPKVITFQQFRYQILPTSQEFQTDWIQGDIKSMGELIKQKNDLFGKALLAITGLSFPHTEVVHKLLQSDGTRSVYRIGAKREIDREQKDFTHETLENWPSLIVVLDNAHDEQVMFIEKNPRVFQIPKTVAGIFEENINQKLSLTHLRCYFEPMFEQAEFWTLVRRHSGKITVADFELISPNMARISGNLTVVT